MLPAEQSHAARIALSVTNDKRGTMKARPGQQDPPEPATLERYNLASVAARAGIWDWNLESGELFVDPNVKALLGYAEHEIPNDIEAWLGYVHPDDRVSVREKGRAHIEGISPEYCLEHRMLHKDGSVRWFMVRGAVIRAADGTPQRFVGIDTDITERKALEQRIADMTARREVNAGRALHDELSQELTGIAMQLKVLARQLGADGSERVEALEIASAGLSKAINSTRRLALGLSPVLDTSVGMVAALGQLARHAREVFGVACEVRCQCDRQVSDETTANHLVRIAEEAVKNAVVHGGAMRIDVSCSDDDGWLALSVEDDGVGIPDERQRGAGMGLQIVQYRAMLLGGRVNVEARADGGTRVSCRCPA